MYGLGRRRRFSNIPEVTAAAAVILLLYIFYHLIFGKCSNMDNAMPTWPKPYLESFTNLSIDWPDLWCYAITNHWQPLTFSWKYRKVFWDKIIILYYTLDSIAYMVWCIILCGNELKCTTFAKKYLYTTSTSQDQSSCSMFILYCNRTWKQF